MKVHLVIEDTPTCNIPVLQSVSDSVCCMLESIKLLITVWNYLEVLCILLLELLTLLDINYLLNLLIILNYVS